MPKVGIENFLTGKNERHCVTGSMWRYIRIVVVHFYHTTVGTGSFIIPNLTLKTRTCIQTSQHCLCPTRYHTIEYNFRCGASLHALEYHTTRIPRKSSINNSGSIHNRRW